MHVGKLPRIVAKIKFNQFQISYVYRTKAQMIKGVFMVLDKDENLVAHKGFTEKQRASNLGSIGPRQVLIGQYRVCKSSLTM